MFESGKGVVNMITTPNRGSPMDFPFDVIDTDYDNYIIIYSCIDMGLTGLGYVDPIWVMTRTPEPS